MKINQLIHYLEQVREQHGNIEVVAWMGGHDAEPVTNIGGKVAVAKKIDTLCFDHDFFDSFIKEGEVFLELEDE